MCKKCNNRTYFRFLEYIKEKLKVRYFACNCIEDFKRVEKLEDINVTGINNNSGEILYSSREVSV